MGLPPRAAAVLSFRAAEKVRDKRNCVVHPGFVIDSLALKGLLKMDSSSTLRLRLRDDDVLPWITHSQGTTVRKRVRVEIDSLQDVWEHHRRSKTH
jgi:hypothetical protein